MAKLKIPASLEDYTQGRRSLELAVVSLDDLLKNLKDEYPNLADKLYDREGNLRKFVNVYLNQEYIDNPKRKISLKSSDTIQIIVPVAGG